MGERVKNNVEATDVAEKDARGGEGGMLSLVGTPIGNLSDASPRVLETLRGADVLLCEDTRVTSKLLARFGIRVALERCDENVIASRVEGVLARVAGGARVVSTGRSDYPNQINNVLAFPAIFRGAFDVRASEINEEMKIAASNALANLISDEELNENYIIPAA